MSPHRLAFVALIFLGTLVPLAAQSRSLPLTWALDGKPTAAIQSWWATVESRYQSLGLEATPSVTLSGRAGAWALVGQREGAMVYLPFAAADEEASLEAFRLLQSLGRSAAPPSSPVEVDRFELTSLQGVDLPLGAANLMPSGVAVRDDGRLVVAAGSTVLEMDQRWMVVGQPAKDLSDRGLVNFAWTGALTPAGTLVVRSADGSQVWTIAEGAAPRQGVGDPASAGLPSGVLSDGRLFTVTSNPPAVHVSAGLGPATTWALPEGGAVLAASPGPGGTLWLADTVRGLIRVVSADGVFVDAVVPEVPRGTAFMKLKVASDGSFLVVTNRDLRRFNADGSLRWSWVPASGWPSLVDAAVGPGGLVYVADFSGRSIYRLTDRPDLLAPPLEALRRAADDRERALAYRDQGADEAALVWAQRVLADRPADAEMAQLRLAALRRLGEARAASAAADAERLLARFGPETGRDAYRRAMKTWESLLADFPGDPALRSQVQTLRDHFARAETQTPAPTPQIRSVDLGPLFPALMRVYRQKPAGHVEVTNATATTVKDLRASVFIPKYMDFPSEGPVVASLSAGAPATLDLTLALNDRVLELDEDLPVQAQVTLSWTEAGQPRSLQTVRPVTLFRRTALTWDDTGKLASFITPNDEAVGRVAFALLPDRQTWPVGGSAVSRAAAIADGLGRLPLRYVPDPQTGFEKVFGSSGAVDTVRFPRNTLVYRGGDCDDTTALLSSAYEAAGLPTAILTTPGHVFLAFDTGAPAADAWLYEGEGRRGLVRQGSVWIPVETTVLPQGFAEAWRAASELCARYAGTADFEFLPLAQVRPTYPPLPLPSATTPPPAWDQAALKAQAAATQAALSTLASRPQESPNRQAHALALWGKPAEAEALLKSQVARQPSSPSAYLNLASLALTRGDRAEATRWLAGARKAAPGAEAVTRWAAQAGLDAPLVPGPAVAGDGTTTYRGADATAAPTWVGE